MRHRRCRHPHCRVRCRHFPPRNQLPHLCGTGREAPVRGLKIGGKTGTAEVERGGHIVDKTTWFASFAPVDKPKWAVVVMVAGVAWMAASTVASSLNVA